MTPSILAIILALIMILTLATLSHRSRHLKQAYYLGIGFWSKSLPVMATAIYLAILSANLFKIRGFPLSLDLGDEFTTYELIGLFLVGPLFLTRLGNLMGALCTAYTTQKLLIFGDAWTSNPALFLVMGSSSIVALLGDKMPWLATHRPHVLANKMREIILICITIGALAIVFAGIIKIYDFNGWIQGIFALHIPHTMTMAVLVAMFIGWLSVALGFTRHLVIPILALPSLFVLAFVTKCPSDLLIIPFVICLALSLATAERRQIIRRQRTSFS